MLFCIGVTVIEYTVVPKYLVLGRSGVSARVRPGEGDPAGMWLYRLVVEYIGWVSHLSVPSDSFRQYPHSQAILLSPPAWKERHSAPAFNGYEWTPHE